MSAERHNAFQRLFRGETSYDFAGRWRRWFAISGAVILIGLLSVGLRGLNFSIDFKGGTVWEVASTAPVSHVRDVVGSVNPSLRQASIQVLTNRQTGKQTVKVEAPAKVTANSTEVADVTASLAKMAGVSANEVQLNDVGPSWGADITNKAIKAVIAFLVIVSAYIWLRFEGKMALAALVALLHDIVVTVGIYSLSGFQVSPDTVIAFLTILGYSLYDTIVVFDKIEENTKGLASTNRLTYTDTVNLSMNQVLARSLNTSFVAIIPILSILVIGAGLLGASALQDFGLALFVGLTTGAYSSIFIASPLLALIKEREPRYAEIRRRLANRAMGPRLTPAAAAAAYGGVAQGTGPQGTGPQGTGPQGTGPRPGAALPPGAPQRGAGLPAPLAPSPTPGAAGGRYAPDPGQRRRVVGAPSATGTPVFDVGVVEVRPEATPGQPVSPETPAPAELPSAGHEAQAEPPWPVVSWGNRPPPRPRKKGRRR
ncbi:MAG: protein translocase subunit SecF [Acidimicrobiales bacterium]